MKNDPKEKQTSEAEVKAPVQEQENSNGAAAGENTAAESDEDNTGE